MPPSANNNSGLADRLTEHPHRSITNLSTVFHVGHLYTDRENPVFSQEGQELSISMHPDA